MFVRMRAVVGKKCVKCACMCTFLYRGYSTFPSLSFFFFFSASLGNKEVVSSALSFVMDGAEVDEDEWKKSVYVDR